MYLISVKLYLVHNFNIFPLILRTWYFAYVLELELKTDNEIKKNADLRADYISSYLSSPFQNFCLGMEEDRQTLFHRAPWGHHYKHWTGKNIIMKKKDILSQKITNINPQSIFIHFVH